MSNINTTGIISTGNDKDAFVFSLQQPSNVQLAAVPFNTGGHHEGANLDIKLTLYDAQKNTVQVYSPADSMSAAIDTVLPSGEYYLVVEGTGNVNATDYGSLGSYTITGLYSVLPVCTISLQGTVRNITHQLNWQIDCNEAISSVQLQSSVDAVHFDNISNVTSSTAYHCVPLHPVDMYYRLQVNTRAGNTFYSTTTLLKKPVDKGQFIVSSFVTSNIRIIAPAAFTGQLLDISGNRLMQVNGFAGYNHIDMHNKPAGAYILILTGCGETKTVRVLKQ